MTEIKELILNYHNWLKENTDYSSVKNNFVEITTPFLDRHNDHIQIYLTKKNDDLILSDNGFTIDDLKMEGCYIESDKRKGILEVALNGFGVSKNEEGALYVKASANNFPQKKHQLLQAILAVNDMFYLSSPHVASLFFEDVREWLDTNDVRYSERVSFTGHSGFNRLFDFLIPKSKQKPERVIKTINKPDKNATDAFVMSWLDTKEVRPQDAIAIAIVNDNNREVSTDVVDALRSYQIEPLIWSKRKQSLSLFTN